MEKFSDSFAVSVSSGEEWVYLSDGIDMWVSPEGFGSSQVGWRRETAESRFYHGQYLLHAVKNNVTENVTVYLRGDTQNAVTELVMLLEELFSQPTYQVRVQYGDHRETWYCQTADYTVERSHVLMHNHMAKMTFQVPRLPETTKEIVL